MFSHAGASSYTKISLYDKSPLPNYAGPGRPEPEPQPEAAEVSDQPRKRILSVSKAWSFDAPSLDQDVHSLRQDTAPDSNAMPGDALSGLGLGPLGHSGHGSGLRSRRKMSTPAALLSHGDHHALTIAQMAAMAPRRRFSNVSDAVSRKLSSTIGWRTAPAHSKIVEIVNQGKALCGQYIRSRLKRAGLFDRKCGLQRLRSAANLNAPHGLNGVAGAHPALREVFCELNAVGLELERRHPKVYTGVARQAANGPIVSDKAAASALTAVGRDLLKQDVTWGKVVALYAVAGGLAVDCVRQGHPEYLHSLVAAVGQLLEDELAPWIADNGGWAALVQHCTLGVADGEVSVAVVAGLICAVMAAVLGAVLALRTFGKFALI